MSNSVNVFYFDKVEPLSKYFREKNDPSEKTIHMPCRWKPQVDETNIDFGSFLQGFKQRLSITLILTYFPSLIEARFRNIMNAANEVNVICLSVLISDFHPRKYMSSALL